MSKKDKSISKKRFLSLLGLGAFSTMFGNVASAQKKDDSDTVKMLTADGELVEVDRSKLPSNDNKPPVSNASIKEWLKSHQ